jgi:sugar O-acyltransferase (sialic acid O-acetyltransferase NeuD family)
MRGMQSMTDIIIVGAGGHSKVVADAAARAGFTIKGFVDDRANTAPLPGYRLIGSITDLADLGFFDGAVKFLIAIGDNRTRMQVVEELALPAGRYATVIDPSAVVSRYASIAEGSVVLQGAIVNAGAEVGQHAILNTGCTVDHDCRIGDYAHVSPGANLAGGVAVGEGAHVGVGACAIPGCSIGAWSLVGAGAAVVRDIPVKCVAIGVPAKVVRTLP